MNPKGRIRTALAFLLVVVAISMTSAWLVSWSTAAPPAEPRTDLPPATAKPRHPVTILRPGVILGPGWLFLPAVTSETVCTTCGPTDYWPL